METIIAIHNESEYNDILRQAVVVIETARNKAARAIAGSSNEMHWEIGKLLYDKKLDSKHGDKVVKRLSADLKAAYPKMGMSERNLWDMKRFYVRFRNSEPKLRQAVAVLPWWNINKLISKLGDDDEAILYYAEQTVEKQWDRDLMVNAINMGMHNQLPATNISNNFALTLPHAQAAYASEVFKDSEPKLRQAVAVLPWWNINKLISKLGDDDEAIQYYAGQTVEKQWDRDLMVNALNMGMHIQLPVTNTSNNFALTLPQV